MAIEVFLINNHLKCKMDWIHHSKYTEWLDRVIEDDTPCIWQPK